MAKRKAKTPQPSPPAQVSKTDSDSALDIAAPLSAVVQIQNVLLAEARISRGPYPSSKSKGLISIKIDKHDRGVDIEGNTFWVKLPFSLVAESAEHSNKEPVLIIAASFVLTYSAPSVESIKGPVIDAFASTNGVYNAWPYWREFVQNITTRMGFHSIIIPVFRLYESSTVKSDNIDRGRS